MVSTLARNVRGLWFNSQLWQYFLNAPFICLKFVNHLYTSTSEARIIYLIVCVVCTQQLCWWRRDRGREEFGGGEALSTFHTGNIFPSFHLSSSRIIMITAQVIVLAMTHTCNQESYSETSLIWTPLGPTQSVLIRGVSWFQGLLDIRMIRSGPHACSVRITVDVCISGVSARRSCTVYDAVNLNSL